MVSTLPDSDTLESVADWRVDLTSRINRARLRYELVGGNAEEIVALGAEAHDFSRVCQMLKGVIHA